MHMVLSKMTLMRTVRFKPCLNKSDKVDDFVHVAHASEIITMPKMKTWITRTSMYLVAIKRFKSHEYRKRELSCRIVTRISG